MTAATSHRLEGLEPDNLLAFLALLGLMRALDLARPEWQPRAYWDLEEVPLRPILTTRELTTRKEICSASRDGLLIFSDALRPFSWPRSKHGSAKKTTLLSDRSRQKALSKRCVSALSAGGRDPRKRLVWQLRCDLVASAGTGRTDPKRGEVFEASPMKLPSGQMAFIGAQFDIVSTCTQEDICKSLFSAWTYGHKGNSLRLSPDEARRYAYRASDPSPEGSRTELGATALSALGLLAFTMTESKPRWRMVAYAGSRSSGEISWPIWGAAGGSGASLQSVMAMLRALPFEERQSPFMNNLAQMIATARRYVLDPEQGDYGNVARAAFSFLQRDSRTSPGRGC